MLKSFAYKDGKEKDPYFYNHYIKSASKTLEESNSFELYKIASTYLENKGVNIMDIGCGSGRFAKLLYQLGYRNYYGVDFADKLIEMAKDYVPGFRFDCLDVFDITDKFQAFDVFICLEVLEHMYKDKELLFKIPVGKQVIISVPNFYSKDHVRAFNSIEEVEERYKGLLLFKEYSIQERGRKMGVFVGKNDPERRLDIIKIFILKGHRV